MSVGIAIFVKTPGVSPVKTRLAKTHGQQYADSWYQLAATAVAEVAILSGATVYWAVGEPEAMAAPMWQNMARICQVDTEGEPSEASIAQTSLGARMHHVHAQLLARHDAGILLGADLPHLDVAVLRAVAAYLRHAQARRAIAPALDGGFWLYGANRLAPLAAWESAPYSSADTCAKFNLAMQDFGVLHTFASATDVDTGADLIACADALAQLKHATAAQHALLNWMGKTAEPLN